jgi:hypothetical protein
LENDGITDHIRAREEEHFRKKDRELIEKLRQADAAAKARQALEQEAGVHDPAVLRELEQLGFTPGTLALLPLIPLLQVAWANQAISAAERTLLLNLARARGISPGTAADGLLNQWLEHPPASETFHKANRLIAAIVDAPLAGPLHVSGKELVEQCDAIARASGGIFGIGRVSAEERAALEEIAAAVKRT